MPEPACTTSVLPPGTGMGVGVGTGVGSTTGGAMTVVSVSRALTQPQRATTSLVTRPRAVEWVPAINCSVIEAPPARLATERVTTRLPASCQPAFSGTYGKK